MKPIHPMQPLVTDQAGTVRFKENAIVRYLLEVSNHRGVGLNELAAMGFSKDDHRQFAQLIGYSLSGYQELSYAEKDAHRLAHEVAKGKGLDRVTTEILEEELQWLRDELRGPMQHLFGVDLTPEVDDG